MRPECPFPHILDISSHLCIGMPSSQNLIIFCILLFLSFCSQDWRLNQVSVHRKKITHQNGVKTIQWKKDSIFNKWYWHNWHYHVEECELIHSYLLELKSSVSGSRNSLLFVFHINWFGTSITSISKPDLKESMLGCQETSDEVTGQWITNFLYYFTAVYIP